MRSLLCLVLLSVASLPIAAASPAEWRRDLEQIIADIKATHPEPFADVGERALRREAARIADESHKLTEAQRVVRAMALVGRLGDGHTRLEPVTEQFARWYLVRFYLFSDGLLITGAHRTVADLAGAEVITIGGRPALEAVDAAAQLFGRDNSWDGKERLYALHNASLMQGLGFAREDGSLELKVRLRQGNLVTRRLEPEPTRSAAFDWIFRPEFWGAAGEADEWVSAYRGVPASELRKADPSRPLHLAHRGSFHAQNVPEKNAYYIQVNVVGNTREESLAAFFRRAMSEVDAARPKRLLIDLRYNFGGDGSLIPQAIDELSARKKSPPWGELYVLTGRRTFSAAVLFLDALLDRLQPTLAGEPAGAALNTYGDSNDFTYPKTGLRMYVSHERHQQSQSNDLAEIIPVDYPARFSSADYFSGRDPAIDAILSGAEVRSIESIALASGAAAASAAYGEREKKFGADPTWRKPHERTLRAVMRVLDDQGSTDEAIGVATLNTTINPGEWRTWFNLGNLQMKAGRKSEAIESYRRSLALDDPTNFNAERLRRLVAEAEK